MGDTQRKRARAYLRVSVDRSGRERSLDEQDADNLVTWSGWVWGEAYRDTGSASRFGTGQRAGWDQLVGDLRADRFGADVLVIWESSRGSRRVSEWVELIELAEERGVLIAVTTHRQVYDPANPRHRRSLLEDAVDSEYETAKSSERIKRAMSSSAAEGKPHGRVPFGFRRVYDATTGRLVGQEPDPVTAPYVVELYERLRAGHSLRSISRDWDARGIRNGKGEPLGPEHLRNMALKRSYVGEREHRGEVFPAAWEGIVGRETWLAVYGLLSDPSRLTYRDGRAKHLLSRIAVCGVCGKGLVAGTRKGKPVYLCPTGQTKILKATLDEYAEAVILDYLSDERHAAALTAPDADESSELAQVRGKLAEVRAELDDLADQVGSGRLSASLAARAEPQIQERIKACEERERELATPSRLRGLVKPGENVAKWWQSVPPIEARREIARLLLAPDLYGTLVLSPSGGRQVPVEERTEFRRAAVAA